MQARPIRTPEFYRGDSLLEFVCQAVQGQDLNHKILAVTSKIVSLAERRTTPFRDRDDKARIIAAEADKVLGKSEMYDVWLTIKHGLLIPSAGIDESNSASGELILYPRDPWASARELWKGLADRLGLKKFGVLITDSHTTPLRRGVTGIALSCHGFEPVRSLVGKPDLFGKPLVFTHVNIADALATAAVYTMGEADERIPLCLVEAGVLTWTDRDVRGDLVIPPEEDLFTSLLGPAGPGPR